MWALLYGRLSMIRRGAALAAFLLLTTLTSAVAIAEPPPDPAPADATPAANVAAPPPDAALPVDDAAIPSAEPATTKTPDGFTLTVSSKDETMRAVPPLTTAVSSRDYIVGGTFQGSIRGPGEGFRGVLEVGYQIGCGIDMSTSNGVTMTGSIGETPGLAVPAGAAAVIPTFLFPISGGIAVALKPGLVNIIPVNKKEFKGEDPWVSISNFHVKIDGCVGQSFIRSYATLTRSTEISDSVLSWMGTTKTV
jgi:hypothetical protein